MSGAKQSGSGHVVSIIAAIACVAAAALLLINRQYVLDQVAVWQFAPGSDVASLASRSGMSGKGTFYFYASKPAVEDAQKFNSACERKEASTAILGCYTGQNIHVYNVTDVRLDGIKEVTAAHEMLHAAYARLGGNEKKKVDALLEAEYKKLKDNPDFSERMAFYSRTEPGERANELHSVIGTEVASISPELEAHYSAYFSDRSKVVGLHAKYAKVFSDLQAKGKALSAQLTTLGNKIEADSARYNADVSALNSDIGNFNSRASGGGFSSQEEFEKERAALVSRANGLEARRNVINDEVAEYNSLRQELAAVSSQSEALNRSVDSSLAPAPSL
jgi:hypothetical protein